MLSEKFSTMQAMLTCNKNTPPTVIVDVAEKFRGLIAQALTDCGYTKVEAADALIYSIRAKQ